MPTKFIVDVAVTVGSDKPLKKDIKELVERAISKWSVDHDLEVIKVRVRKIDKD